jgi:uncharacterized protein (DUF1330 family)
MALRLCVLLWPHPGREDALRAYEDAVLALLGEHGARLVAREHIGRTSDEDPSEVQIIELEDDAALEAYLSDPRRLALEGDRASAIARTQVLRVAGAS